MHITVRYFAGQRDITGQQSERLEIAEGSTLATVWQHLESIYPGLAPFRGRVLYAQNARFVPAETELRDGDTVAFIPPVSGGAFRPFVVTTDPLDPAPLVTHVSAANVGAIVTFAGTARDHFGDRATARLEYEAYTEMAEQVLADIAAEAITRFGVVNVAIHHRIGILEIGETAVLVVVASAHRGPALEATGWMMDRIKEIAPIWKKEHWADGDQEWIGHEKDR
jgi:molybdopterin synthase catalytic subunit